MSNFTLILSVVIVGLVVLFAWNSINFWNFKKQSLLHKEMLNDSKYWELKYKYEFILAIVTLISGVAIFIGFNTKTSIEASIKGDFKAKVDTLKINLDHQVNSLAQQVLQAGIAVNHVKANAVQTGTKLHGFDTDINRLRNQQLDMLQRNIAAKNQVEAVKQAITDIQGKNILKQEFYVIDGLNGSANLDSINVYQFSELKTNLGDRLPLFKKPPVVIPITIDNAMFHVARTTTTSVSVHFQGETYVLPPEIKGDHSYLYNKKSYPLTLLIYEVK
jgi:hypothetical protein